MRRVHLTTLLITLNLGILIIAAAGVAWLAHTELLAQAAVDPRQAQADFIRSLILWGLAGGVLPCEEQCPIVHARFRAGARATEHLLLAGGQRRTVVITSAASAAGSAGSAAGGDSRPAHELRQVQVLRDETELEATRRLRDAVLANVSHEFRTPLSAQLASIELLLDQLPDLSTDQIAELVISLQRGTLRLTHLIDNLLESVRLEAGQFAIRKQTVALDEVVEAAVELGRALHDQRDQAVQGGLPYPLPRVGGDPAR